MIFPTLFIHLKQHRLRGNIFSVNDVPFCISRFFADSSKVTLGDISKSVRIPQNLEYMPQNYLQKNPSQTFLKHLRWMMQKDLLGQDIFLIGPPGPLRRCLALSYLELTTRESEFITLTRDTTESDLKQRREIRKGTSHYHDQSAVRAAVNGRVLILEGVEKAERNVLPVLNNLLENREMQLEDGRLLIPPQRYDKLLKTRNRKEMDEMKLVRVCEDFRVIALGLPSPPYVGHPLDPPLRSRFQARDVSNAHFKDYLEELLEEFESLPSDLIAKCLSLSHTLNSDESKSLSLPDFPVDGVKKVLRIMCEHPQCDLGSLMARLYPAPLFLGRDGLKSASDAFASFELHPFEENSKESSNRECDLISVSPHPESHKARVKRVRQGSTQVFEVIKGTGALPSSASPSFVPVAYHGRLLSELLESHSAGDFCVVGPKGCGKSALVNHFAHTLGYQIEPILLYQDMTARDLIQQRSTDTGGDTHWELSPLTKAAVAGKMAVLDGLHRLHHGTMAVLHRLVHDRELQLYDGSRLLRDDRFALVKKRLNLSDEEMGRRKLFRVHPSFRIVGLSEPPKVGAPKEQWMTPETLSLFLYHSMRTLQPKEMNELVQKKIAADSVSETTQELISLSHRLAQSSDPGLKSVAKSLSLRQIIRIARRLRAYPDFELHSAVYKACLARFLPPVVKTALDKELETIGLKANNEPVSPEGLSCEVNDGELRIGNTKTRVGTGPAASKVPDTLFYDISQHVYVLENMLQDWLLGDHLLLIGNQGVGKNKLADRFLQLLNRPREYIQLHRDTTVQSLTVQPSVRDGLIRYEDSPLVTAVKNGHVLVVDEADKAPTHVTCVLKTLVESGEMLLSDGRRIVPRERAAEGSGSGVVAAHPDFRMIVLANRPGFPFLGNDFFSALGDLFSCHAIDNPSVEAETALLREYGPDVDAAVVKRLVAAFGELRDMADRGLIQYPYSTREVVNVVKHLQKYKDDGVASVVRNVLDFDRWSGESREAVMKVMHKHGIPVGASTSNIKLSKRLALRDPVLASKWSLIRGVNDVVELSVEKYNIAFKGPVNADVTEEELDPTDKRSLMFTEQESFWSLPFYETSFLSGLSSGVDSAGDPVIHVVTTSPFMLYSLSPETGRGRVRQVRLYDIPLHRASRSSKINVSSLPKGLVAIHDEANHFLLISDSSSGNVWGVELADFLQSARDALKRTFGIGQDNESVFVMDKTFCSEGDILFWESAGNRLQFVSVSSKSCHSCSLPFKITSCSPLSKDQYLLTDEDSNTYVLKGNDVIPNNLFKIQKNDLVHKKSSQFLQAGSISNTILSSALQQNIESPSSMLALPDDYAAIAVGFPDLSYSENDIYLFQRRNPPSLPKYRHFHQSDFVATLPQNGQIIRVLEKIPQDVINEVEVSKNCSYLEITDISSRSVAYLPVPRPKVSSMWNFLTKEYASLLLVAPYGDDGVSTVDILGGVRLWNTSNEGLQSAIASWKRMVGNDENPVRLEVDRESGEDVTSPKHGKVDSSGNPHVGGNTWAGGTGGRDTAGLGGKGGPYRLDAGHDVYQVPQWEKDAVPEEVRRAARDMAQKAFKERLQEIQMSEYEASLYEKFLGNVKPQINALRNIISSLQAKSKERQWIRHRTDGELDDLKLIEGVAGEKNIYRHRREEEPEVGAPMTKPKRLRLVVDVSGSMYRFNGHDGRLERELEATLMVMEAFTGFEDKFKYDIYGHSGEEADVVLAEADKPPKDNKERLDVLKTMQAHSQFCLNGDNTLDAFRLAINSLKSEDSDESFVVLLSDANLDRYGIHPQRLNQIISQDDSVNSYVIFIGSLGDQADRIKRSLPAGRSFVCLDVSRLPQILQQIFSSSMLT